MIISAVTLAVGCAYAVLFIKTGFGIPCPFHLITGLNCPGCGVTRMAVSLLKLDFAAAFNENAGLFCLLPFILALFANYVYRYIRYGTRTLPKPAEICAWVIAGLLLVWGAVRNFIGM